jgi:hypothetical protein
MSVQPIRPLELMRDRNITDYEFDDFVGVWKNFVPRSFCQKIIDLHTKLTDNSSIIDGEDVELDADSDFIMDGTEQFPQNNLGRSDISILVNQVSNVLSYQCHQYLQACVQHYINHYGQLKACTLMSSDLKCQKTEPMGGYHVWHYENSSYEQANRELTWIIYLNDMPDNEGETEFLYQKRRIKPEAGTVIIWPAGMTHVHRGLTVYTQNKYILTGWYLKVP